MNKTFYLAFSGLMMISTGVTLFFSSQIGIENAKILVPLFMVLSGIGVLLFSNYDKIPKVGKQYHLAQGLGLIGYAAAIVFIQDTLPKFLLITTYFVIAYGLFELTFTLAVLNSNHKINKTILLSRLIAGGVNLIGGFVLLLSSLSNPLTGLSIASILILIGGLSILVFIRDLKNM